MDPSSFKSPVVGLSIPNSALSNVFKFEPESKEEAVEENIVRSDESDDGKRWMEYKITKVVSVERSITYVKVPKGFHVNKKAY